MPPTSIKGLPPPETPVATGNSTAIDPPHKADALATKHKHRKQLAHEILLWLSLPEQG
jgi:hypothetical protein